MSELPKNLIPEERTVNIVHSEDWFYPEDEKTKKLIEEIRQSMQNMEKLFDRTYQSMFMGELDENRTFPNSSIVGDGSTSS